MQEKGPTIQKLDFQIIRDAISFWTDLSWGAIRIFLSTLFCKIWIIEKESLNAFGAAVILLINHLIYTTESLVVTIKYVAIIHLTDEYL